MAGFKASHAIEPVRSISDDLFDTARLDKAKPHLEKDDFRSAVTAFFSLPPNDIYVYHAIASVTLRQVQAAVSAGAANGLHDWYLSNNRELIGHPPDADIVGYILLVSTTKSVANVLKGFAANAKKGSIREGVARYLVSKRHLDSSIAVPKRKTQQQFQNPYFHFWAWAAQNLEWCGPDSNTVIVTNTHHILPVLYEHFGCVCPSWEAVEIIRLVSMGKEVLDMGSGNGYWTAMLRRQGCRVTAIDSGMSEYRTMWIADTIKSDGIQWLKKNGGFKDGILLLVYPVVSGEFTRKIVESYNGEVVCVVGTQNGNGYTGFSDVCMDEWMDRRGGWDMLGRVPLPSFPGKDDALFVFRRKLV